MRAEYYQTQQPGMRSNDVHNEVIDMIVTAALYHREIDRHSGIGTKLSVLSNLVKDFVDNDIRSAAEIVNLVKNDILSWNGNVGGSGAYSNARRNENHRLIYINNDLMKHTNIVIVSNDKMIKLLLKVNFTNLK